MHDEPIDDLLQHLMNHRVINPAARMEDIEVTYINGGRWQAALLFTDGDAAITDFRLRNVPGCPQLENAIRDIWVESLRKVEAEIERVVPHLGHVVH